MNGELTVHGHFINLCTVILFNVSKDANVVNLDEIDGHTPSSVSTRATNSAIGRTVKHQA